MAVALAASFEGIRLHSYHDSNGVPTLCYGETQGIHDGQTSTLAACQAWLDKRMAEFAKVVDDALPGQPVRRRAALADFCYNVGAYACTHSGVFRRIRTGDIQGGCNALRSWVYAGGEKLPGLVRRREAERALCLQN